MVKSQNSSRRVPEKSRLVLLLDNVSPYDGASQVVLMVKNPPANAGDIEMWGSILGWGKSPGEGNGNSLQYSCLENRMDRGGWQATVHRVTKSWALKRLSTAHPL